MTTGQFDGIGCGLSVPEEQATDDQMLSFQTHGGLSREQYFSSRFRLESNGLPSQSFRVEDNGFIVPNPIAHEEDVTRTRLRGHARYI
jgi:hypothetical protein